MLAPFALLIPLFRFREPKTAFHCDGHFLIVDSTQIRCIPLLNPIVSMSLSRCNGAPSPQYIQLFLNISVNRVRVEGPSIGRVGVPIQKFGVDSDAGRLHAAVRSMLAVYEEMQAYHPRDVDRGLYICTGTEYRVVEAVGSSERTRSSDTARSMIDPDLASKRWNTLLVGHLAAYPWPVLAPDL